MGNTQGLKDTVEHFGKAAYCLNFYSYMSMHIPIFRQ